jgi:predicted DNA-binding transcriptional regulator YafY
VSSGGRDQLGPIERLVRIRAVLEGAGPVGATQEQLLDVAQYGGSAPDTQRRMLSKDVKYLNQSGWDIQNVAEQGTDGRYVLHARDIRQRVELTPAEQAALARVGAPCRHRRIRQLRQDGRRPAGASGRARHDRAQACT